MLQVGAKCIENRRFPCRFWWKCVGMSWMLTKFNQQLLVFDIEQNVRILINFPDWEWGECQIVTNNLPILRFRGGTVRFPAVWASIHPRNAICLRAGIEEKFADALLSPMARSVFVLDEVPEKLSRNMHKLQIPVFLSRTAKRTSRWMSTDIRQKSYNLMRCWIARNMSSSAGA